MFTAYQFSSLSSCLTLYNPLDCSMPGFPVHHQLPEPTQTHVQWVSDAIQPSHPLSSPSPPAFNLSQHQGLFQWVSSLHHVAKVLEFQLQHQSFQWTPPRLISFRMDWFDLLAVQGTLKSLLQHHSSKASTLWRSAFFIVQLSHPYMTTGKTIALTRWTFVGKVMFLLFNMLSRLQHIYSHLNTVLAPCHKFWYVLFSSSLLSNNLWSWFIPSAQELFKDISSFPPRTWTLLFLHD